MPAPVPMPAVNCTKDIQLAYGSGQRFKYRCEDIHISGCTSLRLPVKRSEWRLNGAAPVHFYVERATAASDPPKYPWNARTPAVNRLRDLPGYFNIELPVDSPHLHPGCNNLSTTIEGSDGQLATLDTTFTWDPAPVDLPLDLSDLSNVEAIQDVGQVVDGLWDLDKDRNAITVRAPVGHDALLLLGGPHQSQEATYDVVFSAPSEGIFVGLSDFFVRHDEQLPTLGIKPGYSSAGLATLTANGFAQCWVAMGDSTWDKKWSWVRKTKPAFVSLTAGIVYSVRHQVIFDGGVSLARFRIWRTTKTEPKRWLCSIDTSQLSPEAARPTAASFGLFQYSGNPTRWSNIKVKSVQSKIGSRDIAPDRLIDGWRGTRYMVARASHLARRKVAKLV